MVAAWWWFLFLIVNVSERIARVIESQTFNHPLIFIVSARVTEASC